MAQELLPSVCEDTRDVADASRLAAIVDAETERVRASDEDKEKIRRLDELFESFAEDDDKLQALYSAVDEAKAQREAFRQLLGELRTAQEKLEQISAHEEELTVPLQYEDSRQKDLFEKCLGLEFLLTQDQAVSLAYRYLDPTDLDRRFIITMDITENQWIVVGMDPHIHGVEAELDELNRTNNLGKFCKNIRNKFKEHVQTSTENK